MTHDPMCPHDEGAYHELGENSCVCDFIAKVRADEREQAARRIEAIPGTSLVPHIPLVLDLYADCAAAVRGKP